MKYFKMLLLLLVLGSVIGTITIHGGKESFQKVQDIPSVSTDTKQISYNLPLYFVPNRGQFNPKVKYYTASGRYTMWLTAEGLVFDRKKRTGQKTMRDVSQMRFLETDPEPKMIALDQTSLKFNVFKGNDPSKWQNKISAWGAVFYKNLYPCIGLKIYGLEKELEYDWIIEPGGEPGKIMFQYKNIENSRIDEDGNLSVKTGIGEIQHRKPFAYQESTEGSRREINVSFRKINENTYGFEVGNYDKTKTLVIDPVIFAYSTYLGGDYEDDAFGVEALGNGRVMVAGTAASRNFPVLNSIKVDKEEYDQDIFVAIIDTNRRGTESLLYSAIIGGAGNDGAYGLRTDGQGNAFVTGITYSSDFPTVNAYQSEKKQNRDIFIFKLDTNRNGVDSLIYSTYFGGSEFDSGDSLALDKYGYVYITGSTDSSDFPTRNAYQSNLKGSQNAFIAKFDTSLSGDASLLYSTYIGGSNWETSHSIAVASGVPNIAYITGRTTSTDYPVRNSYMTDPGDGNHDIFITKLDTSVKGTDGLLYSTYFGGKCRDVGYAIDVDNAGKVYVTGYTESPDFPTRNSIQKDLIGQIYYDVFFLMMDTVERGDDSLLMSTYVGGSYYDTGLGIKVGESGKVYITGNTWSYDFASTIHERTDDGLPPHRRPQVFFMTMDPLRVGPDCLPLFKIFGGAEHDDVGNRIAVENENCVYIAGTTRGEDFPTLNGYQEQSGENCWDAFLTRLDICDVLPIIYLNRNQLYFGALAGGAVTGTQTVTVTNAGKGFLAWSADASESWISVSRGEQTDPDNLSVSVDATGLSAGSYTGVVTVYGNESSLVYPRSIDVYLEVKPEAQDQPAFGQFDSPSEGVIMAGSIPVTGWALDDIGISSVKIYRNPVLAGETGRIYIGDAIRVDGARPDVEQQFSQFPNANKAGWGYMMLSNYLPDGGNGAFEITAVVTELNGNEVSLGTKTVILDNKNAVNPFGTIDTPEQGGLASGRYYVNYGWALTPMPNTIPTDGFTITVWIDGVAQQGNPVYDNYRQDIAELFPGYNNSSGAVGYYYIDTRNFSNGVHSISWSVKDNAGNIEGIGSRFFTVNNSESKIGNRPQAKGHRGEGNRADRAGFPGAPGKEVVDRTGIGLKRGYDEKSDAIKLHPNEDGWVYLEIHALERIEMKIFEDDNYSGDYKGYQQVGMMSRGLPAGSYLDKKKGVFYWQPVAGFAGNYRLVFTKKETNHKKQKRVQIRILPN
jgi:hypothetical protein